jgi:hypothetical protein
MTRSPWPRSAGGWSSGSRGDAAWEIIDRLSHKYVGQPYGERTDRIVFLVEPERAWAQVFG